MARKNQDRLTTLGSLLVFLGVGVWGVYAVMRWGLGRTVVLGDFLPYHLLGVVPGALLRHRRLLLRLFRGDRGTPPS